MLEFVIPEGELYNEMNDEFVYLKEQILRLEHSLISISKWESIWHKPFLTKENRTVDETISYVRCMTINTNIDPIIYRVLTDEHLEKIKAYIEDPMTATWFSKEKNKTFRKETITSELIYYWMTLHQIPFECEKWHLNRLMTLIQVCNAKNKPAKKMSRKNTIAQNKAMNAARMRKMNTTG